MRALFGHVSLAPLSHPKLGARFDHFLESYWIYGNGRSHRVLWVLDCVGLQSVLRGNGVPNGSNSMVVLVEATTSTATSLYRNRTLSLDAASRLHEFSRVDLVYTHHDLGSCGTDGSLDRLHLLGKPCERPTHAAICW